jgi:hypothetical protein
MEFKKSKIADVKPQIIVNTDNETKAKGHKIFPIVYSNIFLLGKKFSGKTTTISTILKEVHGKNTTFIFIGSTVNKDKSYKEIINYYQKKGHDIEIYDDFNTEEDGDYFNVIDRFITQQKEDAKEQIGSGKISTIQQPNIVVTPSGLIYQSIIPTQIQIQQKGGEAFVDNKETKKKIKYIYPLYIIVIDDMGNAMRNKYLTQLLKTNRHYKTMVIMSGQNITDLEPAALRQIDYTIIFSRQPDDKIFKLHDDLDLEVSKEQLLELYKDATSEPFSFLYIGRTPKGDEFRQGFNNKYEL